MTWRFGGLATVVISAATAACGVLLLGGVGPSAAQLEGAPLLAPTDTTEPASDTTEPASETTEPAPETTEPAPETTAPPPATTTPPAPSPVPISVTSPSQGPDGKVVVGGGDVVTIEGQCRVVDGVPLGPVQIWVVNGTTSVIQTGVTAAAWSYQWVAPSDGGVNMLQAWCGDPSGFSGGYPAELQLQVSVVDVGPPPTAAPTSTVVSRGPVDAIPETD